HFGCNIKYAAPKKGFMLWDGDRWKKDEANEVLNYAKELSVVELHNLDARYMVDGEVPDEDKDAYYAARGAITNKLRSQGGINACIKMTETHPAIVTLARNFEVQTLLYNVPGLTLDLTTPTERARKPRREDLQVRQASVLYDPEATCPTWEKFIRSIMCDDDEMVRYLQRWCGYALSGEIREKKFIVLLGVTDTGKTTMMNTLLDIWGEYAVVASMSTFMVKPSGAPTNDIARLEGARIVSASEAKGTQELSEDVVKLITGGGRVVSRFMFCENFEYLPQSI